MVQRLVLALGVALLVFVAGCGFGGPASQALPSKPENLTDESVERYTIEYEETLKRNRLIDRDDLDSVNVDVTSSEVVEISSGYRVDLAVEYHTRSGNSAGYGFYDAAYFVTETVVRRDAKGPGSDETLDPRNGTVIEG